MIVGWPLLILLIKHSSVSYAVVRLLTLLAVLGVQCTAHLWMQNRVLVPWLLSPLLLVGLKRLLRLFVVRVELAPGKNGVLLEIRLALKQGLLRHRLGCLLGVPWHINIVITASRMRAFSVCDVKFERTSLPQTFEGRAGRWTVDSQEVVVVLAWIAGRTETIWLLDLASIWWVQTTFKSIIVAIESPTRLISGSGWT